MLLGWCWSRVVDHRLHAVTRDGSDDGERGVVLVRVDVHVLHNVDNRSGQVEHHEDDVEQDHAQSELVLFARARRVVGHARESAAPHLARFHQLADDQPVQHEQDEQGQERSQLNHKNFTIYIQTR